MTKRKEITIIIGSLLLIGIMLTMLTLQACKQRPEGNDHQEETDDITIDDSSEYQAYDSVETDSMDNTDTTSLDTDISDTTETAETTKTLDANIIPSEESDTNGILKFNKDGIVIGSPADYDTIIFEVDNITITAKEYFSSDRTNIMLKWHEKLKQYAVRDDSINKDLSLDFDNNIFSDRLILMAYSEQLHFGALDGIPTLNKDIKFNINGITLGDNSNNIEDVFGNLKHIPIPDYNGIYHYYYIFENGGFLTFKVSNDSIVAITIALSQ